MLNRQDVFGAVRPLRLVFWGGIICVIDIRINGFDVLNDVLGCVLIAVGVFRLCHLDVSARYRSAMRFVSWVAALAVVAALLECTSLPREKTVGLLLMVFGLAEVAAIIAFCVAMRWVCEGAELGRAGESWRTTTVLFAIIYAIPLGLFYAIAAGAILTGKSFHFQLGPWAIPLILVFFVPLVHLFVSTSRMIRGASEMDAPACDNS